MGMMALAALVTCQVFTHNKITATSVTLAGSSVAMTGWRREITLDAVHLETAGQHGLQMLTAGNKSYRLSSLCKASTKITTNASRTKYHDMHKNLPEVSALIVTGVDDSWMNGGKSPQLE